MSDSEDNLDEVGYDIAAMGILDKIYKRSLQKAENVDFEVRFLPI